VLYGVTSFRVRITLSHVCAFYLFRGDALQCRNLDPPNVWVFLHEFYSLKAGNFENLYTILLCVA
jgi:hypothetical protein